MIGDGGDQLVGKGLVAELLDGEDRDGLKLDAAGPAFAHLGEDRPGDAVLRPDRIEMGAE